MIEALRKLGRMQMSVRFNDGHDCMKGCLLATGTWGSFMEGVPGGADDIDVEIAARKLVEQVENHIDSLPAASRAKALGLLPCEGPY